MNQFIAIDHTTPSHHRQQVFATIEDAEAHVNNNLPNGFAVAHPGGNQEFWIVDMVAKTITQDTETEATVTAERARAEVQRNRRSAYQSEADALFFEEQRGEVSAGTWAAKIDEIKARYPKE